MKLSVWVFFMAAIVSFFTITCSKDSPTEPEKKNVSIVGIWQNTDPAHDLDKGIRFSETDYYYMNGLPATLNDEDHAGTYSIEGNKITVNQNHEGSAGTGVYTYTVSEDVLEFTYVSGSKVLYYTSLKKIE